MGQYMTDSSKGERNTAVGVYYSLHGGDMAED